MDDEGSDTQVLKVLLEAVMELDVDTVELFTRNEQKRGLFDVNESPTKSNGYSLLQHACVVSARRLPDLEARRLRVVRALVDAGADVGYASPLNQLTVLMLAAERAHLDVVRLLLDRGAAVSVATSAGWSALHAAVNALRVDVVAELIERGADVDQVTRTPMAPFPKTPLMRAILAASPEMMRQLLAAGCDMLWRADARGMHAAKLLSQLRCDDAVLVQLKLVFVREYLHRSRRQKQALLSGIVLGSDTTPIRRSMAMSSMYERNVLGIVFELLDGKPAAPSPRLPQRCTVLWSDTIEDVEAAVLDPVWRMVLQDTERHWEA